MVYTLYPHHVVDVPLIVFSTAIKDPCLSISLALLARSAYITPEIQSG